MIGPAFASRRIMTKACYFLSFFFWGGVGLKGQKMSMSQKIAYDTIQYFRSIQRPRFEISTLQGKKKKKTAHVWKTRKTYGEKNNHMIWVTHDVEGKIISFTNQ